MTPEFAKPVNELFGNVLDLVDRIERGESVDLNQEKSIIRQDLDALTAMASTKPGQRLEDFELVRRVLVYWVDEVLTDCHVSWKEMTLEFDYFGEQYRAFRFYEYAERGARVSAPDVIETWYLCLVLGFRGDIVDAYRNHLHIPLPGGARSESEAIKAWAVDFAQLIRKPSLPDFTGEKLVGGVEPLTGEYSLRIVGWCLIVVFLAACVLSVLSYGIGLFELKKFSAGSSILRVWTTSDSQFPFSVVFRRTENQSF